MGLKLVVRVRLLPNSTHLYVRAGFVGDEFTGSVENVARRGNITVGLRRDGHPVYVRIRGAETTSDAFAECAQRLESRKPLTASLEKKINAECLAMMKDLAAAYSAKVLRESLKNVRYEFAAAEECVPV